VVNARELSDSKRGFNEAAIEAYAGRIVGDVEVFHHFVHEREYVRKNDRVRDAGHAKTDELGDGKRGDDHGALGLAVLEVGIEVDKGIQRAC
jgi:hypothetical protein